MVLDQALQGRELVERHALDLVGGGALGGEHREPDEQLGGTGRAATLLQAPAHLQESLERLLLNRRRQACGELLCPGAEDTGEQLLAQLDMVHNAATQEGIGQAALAVAGDDDDGRGPLAALDGRVGREGVVEAVVGELLEQVVGEVARRLVDLVDEQHTLAGRLVGLPQLALLQVARVGARRGRTWLET